MTSKCCVPGIVLNVIIGAMFLIYGFLKLSPFLNKDVHLEMRKSFIRYSRALPPFAIAGVRLNAHILRKFVAYLELFSGAIFLALPLKKLQSLVSLINMGVLAFCIYTHGLSKLTTCVPQIVMLVLLLTTFLMRGVCKNRATIAQSPKAKVN